MAPAWCHLFVSKRIFMIKLDKITKVYESNGIKQTALDDVSLVFPEKGFVVIYGASGCGKTTLLNILGGLDHQTSGKLIVNEKDTSSFKGSDWDSYRNQEVGFIFQQYYLLPHLNVYDNIAITLQMAGKTKHIEDKINAALDEVGILNLRRRFPKAMSGGQQQRVAIARALVADPSVVLADEPTGALDEKNAIIVMKTLKEVSKQHLVVMVTHNEKLAEKYADRLIEISYGKIKSDTQSRVGVKNVKKGKELSKVHLPLGTSLRWSIKNVIKKKSRSIPIMIASAIGLAAVGIVVSMTIGLDGYTKKAQEASLSDYPVYITSYPVNSSEGHKEQLVEFPTEPEVIIEKIEYYQTEHYNSMQKNFMDYMDKMPEEYYVSKDSNSALSFNVFTINGGNYQKISSTNYFTRIAPSFDDKNQETGVYNKNYQFIKEQYEVLAGDLPQSINDCVLVIDTYNRVDLGVLSAIGYETDRDKISFDTIMQKEYHVVLNNDMYYPQTKTVTDKDGNEEEITYYRANGSATYKTLYDEKNSLTLKVTGIIRPKIDSSNSLFKTGILYSPAVTNFIKESAAQSDIVKTQLKYREDYDKKMEEKLAKEAEEAKEEVKEGEGEEEAEEEEEIGIIDVLTGNYFKEVTSGTYKFSDIYQYESRLFDLGYEDRITSIFYYTKTFEDRIKIVEYFNNYNAPKDSSMILKSKDYLEQVTTTFSSLVKTFSTIIMVFAMVSIFIAAILTAILTYISVLERRKEIGLLRSLGARRIDISTMFLSESVIIGLVAAVVACTLIAGLLPLVGKVVVGLVSVYNSKTLQPTVNDVASFQPWVFPAVFVASVLLSTLSASIPAAIAGKKKPADSLRE